MATEQISTPWDEKIGKSGEAVLMLQQSAYRQGVADTEAKYAELVKTMRMLSINSMFEMKAWCIAHQAHRGISGFSARELMAQIAEAALAGLKGEKQ